MGEPLLIPSMGKISAIGSDYDPLIYLHLAAKRANLKESESSYIPLTWSQLASSTHCNVNR